MIQGRYAVRRNGDDDDDDDGGGGVANRHEVAASLVSSSEARAAAAAIRTGGEHKCKRTFTYVLLWRMSAKDNTVSSVTAGHLQSRGCRNRTLTGLLRPESATAVGYCRSPVQRRTRTETR